MAEGFQSGKKRDTNGEKEEFCDIGSRKRKQESNDCDFDPKTFAVACDQKNLEVYLL